MSTAAIVVLWIVGCLAAAGWWAALSCSRQAIEAQTEAAELRRRIGICSGSCRVLNQDEREHLHAGSRHAR